jgi:hypothetical protein
MRWSNTTTKVAIGRRIILTRLRCMLVVAERHMVGESIIVTSRVSETLIKLLVIN